MLQSPHVHTIFDTIITSKNTYFSTTNAVFEATASKLGGLLGISFHNALVCVSAGVFVACILGAYITLRVIRQRLLSVNQFTKFFINIQKLAATSFVPVTAGFLFTFTQ